MKLSEKGIETIFSALLKTIEERDLVFRQISQGVFKKHIDALEFEPDDFEMPTTHNTNKINGLDVKTEDLPTTPKEVRLTVDEAKALLRRIPEFKENGDWQLPIERLKQRIKQAESKR